MNDVAQSYNKTPKPPTTIFWPEHGFMSRFGAGLEDWECVDGPDDAGIDQYEIEKLRRRMARR
jgi:hypothetical protein